MRAGRALTLLLCLTPSLVCASRCGFAAPVPGALGPGGKPAAAILDDDDHMDVNNLDMFVTNRGALAYEIGSANGGLIFPRGTTKTALYAAGLWIGAKVNGVTRVAVDEYSLEFWPGPMLNGTFQGDQPSFHNFAFDAANPLTPTDRADYLAQGGPVDASGDPALYGDRTIWSVFNDANPLVHTNKAGSTNPLNVEVQQTVCAYQRAGALGNVIFVKWRVTAKGSETLDSTYLSIWSDPDLGGPGDDLVGCDTTLALGYAYNATNSDLVYGSAPPAVGFALIRGAVVPSPGGADSLGMTSFVRYINGTDPGSAEETYCYMRGLAKDGTPMHVFDDPLGPVTRYYGSGLNPGQASSPSNWLDSNSNDRRMMLSTGPFTLAPGESQEIIFEIAVGQGTDRLSSINALRNIVNTTRDAAPPATPGTSVLSVSVDVVLDPVTWELSSRAPWLTAVVEPFGASAAAIDIATVRLSGVPAEAGSAEVADRDADGRQDLTLRFPRAALDSRLLPGSVELELSGRLKTGDSFLGTGTLRVVDSHHASLAASLAPNPLNPAGTLRFVTTRGGAARVLLFDAHGRRVRTLLAERALGTGVHEMAIDGRDDRGGRLGSGVYWFRIEAAEGVATGRVVLLQ